MAGITALIVGGVLADSTVAIAGIHGRAWFTVGALLGAALEVVTNPTGEARLPTEAMDMAEVRTIELALAGLLPEGRTSTS
jgi:hypothetical protein